MSRFIWINCGVFADVQRATTGSAFLVGRTSVTGRRTWLGEESGA
jgi:hypothetical protein